jgi:hypothetical protein
MELSYLATHFEAVRAFCRLTGELSLLVGEIIAIFLASSRFSS